MTAKEREEFHVDYRRVLIDDLKQKLHEARKAALQSKDFSEVDSLKSALIEAGVEVRMGKDSVELRPGPDFDPAKLEALK